MTEADRSHSSTNSQKGGGALTRLLRGLIPGTLLGILLFVIYIAMAALAGH